MADVNRILLILHFLGLAMGLSTGFANMMMAGLIAKAAPAEKATLARFPPRMSRIGTIGLTLLWVTGLALLFNKWGGFALMPWQFHVKITAVVLLTIAVAYIHWQQRLVEKGDQSAVGRIQTVGKITSLLALIAVTFAVMTFD